MHRRYATSCYFKLTFPYLASEEREKERDRERERKRERKKEREKERERCI